MNKHDTVIGYIEYLDSSGCVQECIPYVNAEEFKTRIYASLYCGEPIMREFLSCFSLIFRAFPAFCFLVIRCADHKKRPFFIQR